MRFRTGIQVTAASIALLAANGARAQTLPLLMNPDVYLQSVGRAASAREAWAALRARGQTPATAIEPSVTAGKILTPAIDVTKAPGVPSFQITVKAGTVGANDVDLLLRAPSGNQFYQAGVAIPGYPEQRQTETIKFNVTYPFANLYLAPGTFTIAGLYIFAKDGTFISYDASQVMAIFPSTSFTVANSGTPDSQPPSVSKGKILTPSVSLSSNSTYFAARLKVSDDLSGVSNVSVVLNNSSGQEYTAASSQIQYPVKTGIVDSFVMLQPNTPTGTYGIGQTSVCDVAGNCKTFFDPADIQKLFGTTTFQVVN